MRRRGRFALGVGVALSLGVVGLPRLFEPSTLSLARAIRELGPISGWRCAHDATYVYDPRRDSPDPTLLSDAPEQLLRDQVPGLQIEWVEANLRGGDTVVWTRLGADDDPSAERRVYVLSPGRMQTTGIDLDSGWTVICNSHLGDWYIIAEDGLG
jgi:hypothetical protein